MIHQVSFENFRALRHVDVPLGPLTVIVGPNASGKTSILKGLHYLSEATKGANSPVWKDFDQSSLLTRGVVGKPSVCVQTTSGWLKGVFAASAIDEPRPPGIRIQLLGKDRDAGKFTEITSNNSALIKELGDTTFLKLDPGQLALPSNPSVVRNEISATGEVWRLYLP